MTDSTLERWDITPEELTEVIDQNPSLRGALQKKSALKIKSQV